MGNKIKRKLHKLLFKLMERTEAGSFLRKVLAFIETRLFYGRWGLH